MENLLGNFLLAVSSLLLTIVGWIVNELYKQIQEMQRTQDAHSTRLALLEQMQAQARHFHRRESDEIP